MQSLQSSEFRVTLADEIFRSESSYTLGGVDSTLKSVDSNKRMMNGLDPRLCRYHCRLSTAALYVQEREAVSPAEAMSSWVAGAIPSCKLSPAKVRVELFFYGFIIFFDSIPPNFKVGS